MHVENRPELHKPVEIGGLSDQGASGSGEDLGGSKPATEAANEPLRGWEGEISLVAGLD